MQRFMGGFWGMGNKEIMECQKHSTPGRIDLGLKKYLLSFTLWLALILYAFQNPNSTESYSSPLFHPPFFKTPNNSFRSTVANPDA